MSNARNTRRKGSNPLAGLGNTSGQHNVRTGTVLTPRKVTVTDRRVTVGRKISAAAEFPMASHEWHRFDGGRVGTWDADRVKNVPFTMKEMGK